MVHIAVELETWNFNGTTSFAIKDGFKSVLNKNVLIKKWILH